MLVSSLGIMDHSAFSFFRFFAPLSKAKKEALKLTEKYLSKKEVKDLKYLVRQKQADIELIKLNLSKELVDVSVYPKISPKSKDKEIMEFCKALDEKLQSQANQDLFAKTRASALISSIAPHILGFEAVKDAVLLQLFATEKVHILLLGDPGTGKTEILRSAYEFSPISSFGLGSGTTGVGLTISASGKDIQKGLLPMADNGLCCIDELNLLKTEDVGSLYNAMEKGFVSYTKGGKNIRFDARINVLATANPKGDQFSEDVKKIKQQLPFDQALLSRFHLVFIVKKPNKEKFLDITKKIIRQDVSVLKDYDKQFVKDFVENARKTVVTFDQKFESLITDFISKIKDDEKQFLIEINPRLVVGIINMCKARARMFLRSKVTKEDVEFVLGIVRNSLYESH
jgi:replicative DNA helicase Mcm